MSASASPSGTQQSWVAWNAQVIPLYSAVQASNVMLKQWVQAGEPGKAQLDAAYITRLNDDAGIASAADSPNDILNHDILLFARWDARSTGYALICLNSNTDCDEWFGTGALASHYWALYMNQIKVINACAANVKCDDSDTI
jgi:hypothetical protein